MTVCIYCGAPGAIRTALCPACLHEALDDPVEGPLSNDFDADELGLDPEEDDCPTF